MKIGCHAVLFTDRIATETEAVLSGLACLGYEGIEAGSRFFSLDKREYLKEMLDKYNMYLSGLHVAIQWQNLLDNPTLVEDAIIKAVEFLQIMPYKNIILSGLIATVNGKEIDERMIKGDSVKQMAEKLDEIAINAKAKGVSINYHNHFWEFENDALLYNSIIKYAPHVNFALDTGWAAVGGYDPADLIEANRDRFHYIHLRDYNAKLMGECDSFTKKQEAYVNLGTGDMDYKKLYPVLQKVLGENEWAIIEYETGEVSYSRYDDALKYFKSL